MTVINLAASSPSSPTRSHAELNQPAIKRKRSKRRKEAVERTSEANNTVPIERRKRRRNSTHQAPDDVENRPDPHQKAYEGSSSPSELIKSLPIDSLIKYLNQHYLLKSPIQSNPSSLPPTVLPSNPKDRLTDEFNQFALLVSRHHQASISIKPSKSNPHPDLSHPSLPHHHKSLKLIPEAEQTPPISPSIQAHSSSSLSSSSIRPFPTSRPSLTQFYERLFPSPPAIESQDGGHRPHHPIKKLTKPPESRTSTIKSLNEFDQMIIQLVSNHHHQSFPSILSSSSSTSTSTNLLPTLKSSSNVMNRLKNNQFPIDSPSAHSSSSSSPPSKPPSENRGHQNDTVDSIAVESSAPKNDSSECTRQSESTTSTLDHHGFLFKINLEDHPTNQLNVQHPTDHVQIIEDHVLSNFVYSIKTRGNALRPN